MWRPRRRLQASRRSGAAKQRSADGQAPHPPPPRPPRPPAGASERERERERERESLGRRIACVREIEREAREPARGQARSPGPPNTPAPTWRGAPASDRPCRALALAFVRLITVGEKTSGRSRSAAAGPMACTRGAPDERRQDLHRRRLRTEPCRACRAAPYGRPPGAAGAGRRPRREALAEPSYYRWETANSTRHRHESGAGVRRSRLFKPPPCPTARGSRRGDV